MASKWEGFYAAYMTASEGQGFVMLIFANGAIVGVDLGGVLFDGSYSVGEDERLTGNVTVQVPPGLMVIQGASAGPSGLTYTVPVAFGVDSLSLEYIRLETPLGPVNLKLQKLRGLGVAS